MKFSFPLLLLFITPLFSTAQEWKNFSRDSILFTTKYPDNWVNKIKEGKRVFFTSPSDGTDDNFFENINISVSYNSEYGNSFKIKDVYASVTEGLKKTLNEYTEESLQYFKWNNEDASELIYSGYSKSDASLKIRITQWFCFYNQNLYVVTFTAHFNNNNHNAVAKKIMNSIVFK